MKERHCTKQKSYQIKVFFWQRHNHEDKEKKIQLFTIEKSLQWKLLSSIIFSIEFDTNIIWFLYKD